ncbi:hypothetical protein [Rhizobium sp.]|jgi:hypothetical protein|uniref:hypothetical protein n=1 Tax=Rhizobium sp. TaxID=391 RepID=UPI000E9D4B9A|nr:hypothetical protein [Rhizobium sp.]
MTHKTYSIFGAGAAGLYTAWRLLSGTSHSKVAEGRALTAGDVLELYDWGQYDFNAENRGTREPGARIATWFYDDNKDNSYLELGGMRYSHWDQKPSKAFPHPNGGEAPGHRLVTKTIQELGLDPVSIPFNVTDNQLLYLRGRNMYLNDIKSGNPAPYFIKGDGADQGPDTGFDTVEALAFPTEEQAPKTRKDWASFYNTGTITVETSPNSVFQKGDLLKNIGYWNLLVDQLGQEGYEYAADGNGYSSNVINTSSSVSFNINDEFAPGTQYRTLSIGYSGMFNALFDTVQALAKQKGIVFHYVPNTRLHSIVWKHHKAVFTVASRATPTIAERSGEADAAWLAIPPAAVDLVAQATRFHKPVDDAIDVLNHEKVSLYLEAAILQPSYKIGMFFDTPWWAPDAENPPVYPPQITGFVVTKDVIATLKQQGFSQELLAPLVPLIYTPFSSLEALLKAAYSQPPVVLNTVEIAQLAAAARRDTIGPSATDSPVRMVVYFGNNARKQGDKPVYGILASYDDEANTAFWRQLELGPKGTKHRATSLDVQPLEGPRKAPGVMVKMLRKMLAEMHYGPGASYDKVPEPLETKYMDWSLPPFNAGYHEWAPHYDIGDVMRKIRKPSQLVEGADADIFIVGEAFSLDQAWVEGAYCTAESVLNDFFGIEPLIDNKEYPFISPPQ